MSDTTTNPTLTTAPIRFLQLNINRLPTATHAILNERIRDTDILLLLEPRWARIGTDTNGNPIIGPIGHQAWTPLLPMSSIPENTTPRVMAYYRKRPDLDVTLRSDIIQDPDIQILDITQTGKPTTTIVNIYNDPQKKRNSSAYRLRELALPTESHTILTGDWNLHHTLWSNRDCPGNEITDNVVDWLTEKGFSMMNEKGEITFRPRSARGSSSTIDLTFANSQSIADDVIKDWAINPSLAFGSDHHAIQWTIDHGRTVIDNPAGIKYNYKEVELEKWSEAFREALKEYHRELSHLTHDEPSTDQQLEIVASALTRAIQKATAKTIPERRSDPKAKPWWNKELTEATKELNNLNAEHAEFEKNLGFRNRRLQSKVTRARNYLKRLCKFHKTKWAIDKVEEAQTKDIWSFRAWSKGARNYPTPAISRGPNQSPAVTHKDKCDAIRNELFQPPPPLPTEFHTDLTTPHPDDFAYEQITKTEVREALFNASTKTAPGYSQTTYKVLRWAWSDADDYFVNLMRKCLNNGYHPKEWRRAIAVALRKPRKPDYSQPRAYRLIQLLECSGKILESIVAKRLAYLVGRHNLVPGNQFGGRTHSSTSDATLAFTNDIQAAWAAGKVTSALTFDIKGYFDFVNHQRLLHTLRQKRIPLQIVKWVGSFLKDREAAVCLDGVRGEMKKVENGIPQGSPVSPILASFYSAELLEIFERDAR